jgi:desulfoferrodoxin (superoxide reductase-like protein)
VDAEDKSFVMNLSTGSFAHSMAVQHHVSTITLLPQFASQLGPIIQQVGLSVFQNGIKLQPTNMATSPTSPLVRNHVYTIQLVPGQNTIDIWISAPISGLFQGGVPNGKTETQQFFLFIQRSSI